MCFVVLNRKILCIFSKTVADANDSDSDWFRCVDEILLAAGYLQMPTVLEQCCTDLLLQQTSDNWTQVWCIAARHCLAGLKKGVIAYLRAHLVECGREGLRLSLLELKDIVEVLMGEDVAATELVGRQFHER